RYRVPWQCPPRRLEDPARQCRASLETRVARLARGVLQVDAAGLDRRRDDRPRAVCTLAVSRDRRLGLASLDADHQVRQVLQAGEQVQRPGRPVGPEAGPTMAGPRHGVPEEAREPAGVHALGLLGRGLRRTLVRADGPGAGAGRGPVVWDA